jgi:hypothetical protein
MIKNHHWLPDSVYDFLKWDLLKYWPTSDYGVEALFLEYNLI